MNYTRRPGTPHKKDRKQKGAKVYYIDEALRLRQGFIEEVGPEKSTCTMVNQHIEADKTPVKMEIQNNKLRQENT